MASIGEVDAEGQCREGEVISHDLNGFLPLLECRLVRKHPRRLKGWEHQLQKAEMAQRTPRHHLRQESRGGHLFWCAIHYFFASPLGVALRHDHKTISAQKNLPRILQHRLRHEE